MSRYTAVLNKENPKCATGLASAIQTIEAALSSLFYYTDAKLNDPAHIDSIKKIFLDRCSN
jgi:hypothetical protein